MISPVQALFPEGRVELRFAFIEALASSASTLEQCLAWLDDGEKARAARFHFERDRTLYAVAHALVRSVLGEKLGVDGRSLRFVEGAHGRPELAGACAGRLSFNLSHTPGLVALALAAPGASVGMDVEQLNAARSTLDIAHRFFSPSEYEALVRLDTAAQPERFFSLWTLKEAYVKSRGAGLTLPLDRFSFGLDGLPRIGVHFEPSLAEQAEVCRFGLLRVSPAHFAAYALRIPEGMPLDVKLEAGLPFELPRAFFPSWCGRSEPASQEAM